MVVWNVQTFHGKAKGADDIAEADEVLKDMLHL